MASKRKSTIPCMIPSKSKYIREDVILGCLPELLPTIPEDSILSISSNDEETRLHHFLKADTKTSCWERGTYSCLLCCFDTGDLNLFLYHLENCHTVFHSHPNFYCIPCKVSAAKFEDLALHNAKLHPELHSTNNRVSLQVTKRDGAILVEQSLFTKEDSNDYGISITKTPIMKMTKGGRKKIVVSHTVEVHRPKPSSNRPATLTNGTSVKNSPVKSSTHIVSSTSAPLYKIPNILGLPGMVNCGPLWNSNQSSDSNANLPKVMIPLSSIPTYDPAMDLSSFLKTSFGKFPYPTKAELCYLTVVSGFPEEQIKLWFTAQRLKQGISWSPEEIEDTRRKMFSTVFQATPKTSLNQAQFKISQHRLPAQPNILCSNIVPQMPKGAAMSWKGGVIVNQLSATPFKNQKQAVHGSPLNTHHIATTKQAGSELPCCAVENCSLTNQGNKVSHYGLPGKGNDGSNPPILPGTSKSPNSTYSEASIVNLTNIVRKIDCHINDRKANGTSTSNVSTTSICGRQKPSSTTKDSNNSSVSNTSKYNDGCTYSSTSHSTICTNKERNISDHTSRSNNDFSVICSVSSNTQTEFMHPSFGKGNVLPEQLGNLKQRLNHDSFLERKQFLAPQAQSYHINPLSDSQSAFGGLFSNLHQSILPSNHATISHLQEEQSQPSSSCSLSAVEEQSPKTTLLGTPIQSTDFGASQHQKLDTKHLPALDKNSKQSDFEKENLQMDVHRKKSEGLDSEPHSGITDALYLADKNENGKQDNTLHNFTNTNNNKQGISLLRQYIQEVDQWESNSNYLEASKVCPMKINVISMNKSENSCKTISKTMEKPVNDSSSDWHGNESYERHKSTKLLAPGECLFDSANTESHLPDKLVGLEPEKVKHGLCQDRKSIFQSLDSAALTLPIKMKSKEATIDLENSNTAEQDYWEIKDDGNQPPMGNQSLRGHQVQDGQSRDCLRGELLKV